LANGTVFFDMQLRDVTPFTIEDTCLSMNAGIKANDMTVYTVLASNRADILNNYNVDQEISATTLAGKYCVFSRLNPLTGNYDPVACGLIENNANMLRWGFLKSVLLVFVVALMVFN